MIPCSNLPIISAGGLLHEERGGNEQIRLHKRGRGPDKDEEGLPRSDAEVGGVRGASKPFHIVRIGQQNRPEHIHDALRVRRSASLPVTCPASVQPIANAFKPPTASARGSDARGFRALGQRSRHQVLDDEGLNVINVLHEECGHPLSNDTHGCKHPRQVAVQQLIVPRSFGNDLEHLLDVTESLLAMTR